MFNNRRRNLEVEHSALAKRSYLKQRSTTGFDLTEAALPHSSARASRSDVAQQEYNASHVALGYVIVAEIKHQSPAKGHTPLQVTTQRQ